jgi:hypothetical protein
MASIPNSIAHKRIAGHASLRLQMEVLLGEFYSAVGIAPRDYPSTYVAELLADNFEGRFFMRASSELLCFDKQQILTARLGLGDVRPTSRLLSLELSTITADSLSATYCAVLRYGQSAIFHHGSLKAEQSNGRWMLRSIDEDVRLMPESRINPHSDRPRVWIR